MIKSTFQFNHLYFLPFFLFIIIASSVSAQVDKSNENWTLFPEKEPQKSNIKGDSMDFTVSKKYGTITTIEDERVQALLEKEININKEKGTIPGYRIQLFYGSGPDSRKMATEVQSEFLKHYPEIPAYLLFQSPNFKIRVGDFRTKLGSEKFLKEVKGIFQNAFIVKDEITLPDLD